MFGIINYKLFLISGVILNLTPGSDTLYVLARSMQGRRAGIASVLGISTGTVVHTVMAAFGLSIILAKSAFAFNIIKYFGAGYLIYLGFKSIFNKSKLNLSNSNSEKESIKKIYMSGVITNVLNPKVALFFLAFLPQFINTQNSYGIVPFLLLGLTFIFTGTIWCLIVAFLSSFVLRKLKENINFSNYMNKVTGIIFLVLGLKLLKAKQ